MQAIRTGSQPARNSDAQNPNDNTVCRFGSTNPSGISVLAKTQFFQRNGVTGATSGAIVAPWLCL